MYNSLSDIQKHLYSLIKQNNPEYLQQSIRQNIKEAKDTRERPINYARPEDGEKLADFAGMDQQHADQLRYSRKHPKTPALSKEEMATNRAKKDARMDSLRVAHYSDLLRRTENIDPEKLDARTAGQLLMYKIQSGQNIKTPEEQMRDIGMGGALKKSAEQEAREEHLRVAARPAGLADNPNSFGARFDKMSASEMGTIAAAAAKREANAKANATSSNQRISPMYWVTQNDFETSTGERYDPRNAKHRQLFFDLNSSGESTVAPTAGVGQGPAYDSSEYHTMRRRPANIPARYIDVDGKKVANPQARYDTVDGTIANTTSQSRARAQSNADDAAALKRIDADAAKRDVEIRAEARRIVNDEQQTSTSTQDQQRYPVQNQTGNSDIGIDITQQSPDQIAAMNDPFRGGQSGRFGKPPQREMDTWGQGSLPNNSGGMQNANQAMDLTGKSVNSKVSRIA